MRDPISQSISVNGCASKAKVQLANVGVLPPTSAVKNVKLIRRPLPACLIGFDGTCVRLKRRVTFECEIKALDGGRGK